MSDIKTNANWDAYSSSSVSRHVFLYSVITCVGVLTCSTIQKCKPFGNAVVPMSPFELLSISSRYRQRSKRPIDRSHTASTACTYRYAPSWCSYRPRYTEWYGIGIRLESRRWLQGHITHRPGNIERSY